MSNLLIPSRRQVLAGIGASTLAPLPARARDDDLHISVARSVRELDAGRGVHLRLLLPSGSGANVEPVVEQFRKLTGVGIDLTEVDVDEITTRLLLDTLTDATDYDIALPATFGIPDLADAGAILPLDEFAQKYEPSGWREGSLYTIGDTFDGKIYGFQTDGDAYVMFYHKDWLEDEDTKNHYEDAFGTPLAAPRLWRELDRQMEFFHDPDNDRFGGALFRTPGYVAWEWWLRFHAKGVWPLSPDLKPQIDADEGIEALVEMIRAGQWLYPKARTARLFDNWSAYGAGNIFANIGWGGSQKYLNGPSSRMRGRMIHGPTPFGLREGAFIPTPYFNWGWNYVVTQTSREPELAYLFALFASTSVMSTLSVSQTGGYFDPFRPEHYEDPEIIKAYSPEFLKVHEQSMRTAIPDLYLHDQSTYLAILDKWLIEALDGEQKPEVALRRAANQWHLVTQRSNPELQKQRWLALRRKYPIGTRRFLRDLT